MPSRSRGRVTVGLILLLVVFAAGGHAQFEIRDSRLYRGEEPFTIRGTVYSNTPIGSSGAQRFEAAPCLYSRDFPLIAAMGANTVRTIARVAVGDAAFARALAESGLYWLAGFPLDEYYDPRETLSADSPAGAELRARILDDFRRYVKAWADEPRLIAFVFGDLVSRNYEEKFSGSAADFYSLLSEAGEVLAEETEGAGLLTTTVAGSSDVGNFLLGADDFNQPRLSFWSLSRTGADLLKPLLFALKAKTAKPLLVSAFGVDAFDDRRNREDRATQAEAAGALAAELENIASAGSAPLLGGLWASFMDEWWRGGEGPDEHGTLGEVNESFPDGVANPAWMGLFSTERSELPGFDSLRPRDAYFALAEVWDAEVPGEVSQSAAPAVEPEGAVNLAAGEPLAAPGGLVSIFGEGFAQQSQGPLAPAACVSGEPLAVFYAGPDELRAQVPWRLPAEKHQGVVYRAGRSSNPFELEVAPAAPGIFEKGVLPAGRPCPVDTANGVRPGTYLEIYGTGLGRVEGDVETGRPAQEALELSPPPEAWLSVRELPVLYSGLLPGLLGVYQTNVRVPEDFPPSFADLTLVQGGVSSNAQRITVIAEEQESGFELLGPEPRELLLRAGGPPRSAAVRIRAVNSFCELVRFRVRGLPEGVSATIPVGLPGRSVRLTLRAAAAAPAVEGAEALLTGVSTLREDVELGFRVTVLPPLTEARFRVTSGGYLSTVPVARFEMNGRVLYEVQGGGPGRGFNFLTFDPETGEAGAFRTFDTFGSEDDVIALENYLLGLPEGVLVLGAIADEGSLLLTGRTFRILEETLGAQLIRRLDFQWSWAIIARKGAQAPIDEGLRPNGTVVLERTVSFPLPE